MKPYLLAPLALTLAAAPAAAQEAPPCPVYPDSPALLTITGEAKSAAKPDMAVFSAGVTGSGKTAAEALAANSAQMNRVIAALKRAGIAERDIQTSNISLNPVYADMAIQHATDPLEQQVPPIIGYQVANQLTVRQRKLDEFGKVIDTLVSAGANQINGPSFQLENPDAAIDEARIAAVKAARARADLYARAAGVKIKRIASISEGGGYVSGTPMPMMLRVADAGGSTPVAPGEVSLEASVTVVFELEQ